jgi:hypothetical protein
MKFTFLIPPSPPRLICYEFLTFSSQQRTLRSNFLDNCLHQSFVFINTPPKPRKDILEVGSSEAGRIALVVRASP